MCVLSQGIRRFLRQSWFCDFVRDLLHVLPDFLLISPRTVWTLDAAQSGSGAGRDGVSFSQSVSVSRASGKGGQVLEGEVAVASHGQRLRSGLATLTVVHCGLDTLDIWFFKSLVLFLFLFLFLLLPLQCLCDRLRDCL